MYVRFFCLLLSIVPTVAWSQAQDEVMNQSTRDRINFSNLSISTTGMLFGIKGPAGTRIGTPYIDTVWQAGNVKFYGKPNGVSDSLKGVPVRLDLMANEIEIRAGANDVRVAKAPTVRYVDINNRLGSSRFINVREYRGDADALLGFFEQVIVGKLDLLQHPTAYVKKANFNIAMNTGTKDDEIMKKSDWYVAQSKQATKFSPSRKSLLTLMSDRKEQIEGYLNSKKPDLKNGPGLMAVFTYYNGL